MSAIQRPGTVELLFKSAQHKGLQPTWITENGLFVITTPTGERYVNRQHSILNSHVSVSLSANKHLTRLVLERNGLPNIPYLRATSHDEAVTFLQAYGTIIAKPLKGAGSVGIVIIKDASQLHALAVKDYILEQYAPGKEMRYLVLNNEVIAVHESRYGASIQPDRALERISYSADEWKTDIVDLSLKVSQVLGMSFAAVDYLVDAQGNYRILEVNSRPGMKWFHNPSEGPAVNVAGLFLDSLTQL